MKHLKKLLSALLVIAMMFSFAACGSSSDDDDDDKEETKISSKKDKDDKDDKDSEKNKEDEGESAEEVVTAFMDAYCEFDFETASEYVDDPGMFDESLDDYKESMISDMLEGSPEMEDAEDEIRSFVDALFDAMIDTMSYEITDTDVDDDEATVTVDFTMVDTDVLSMDDTMEEVTVSEEFMNMYNEILGKADTLSEEEMMVEIYAKLFPMMSDAMVKTIKETDTKTESAELVLTKDKKGNWVIDTEASDMDLFKVDSLDLDM